MHSCIYSGHVRHRRFRPCGNAFRYAVFLMYLDLDELPHVFDGVPLWSVDRPNLACWRRRDYLGPRDLPIAEAVRYRVKHHTGQTVNGPVRMLCHLRYAGYCFNPVVFYYCFDRTDSHVETIVAEITNTPWGERHAYVLPECANQARGMLKRFVFPKAFHVSPFMPMDITYDWRFSQPGAVLAVHMEDHDAEGKIFDATVSLRRREIGRAALMRTLVAHPAMTLKVVTLIHWQALRLWRKRVPFIPHPARRPETDKDKYATQDKAARYESM